MVKKSLMFCVISYLLARLELALHISKTTFEKLKPGAQIERLSRFDVPFDRGEWIFSEDQNYYLNFTREKKIMLHQLPPQSRN